MRYGVLGPLEVWAEDGTVHNCGGRNPRTVIGVLLAYANEVVSIDALADAIWRDSPPAKPKASLQVLISRTRKLLGADRLVSRGPGYVLRVGPDELDAEVFERLTREAQQAADSGFPAAAASRYMLALELWRGEAFADFVYDDFSRVPAARLQELRERAEERLLAAQLQLGSHDEVVGSARALLEQHPLREGLWGYYMLALYRSGRQADALRAFRRAQAILGEELGIEPGSELRRLEEQIILQDPQLDDHQAASVTGEIKSESDVALLVATGAGGSPEDVNRGLARFEDVAQTYGAHVGRRLPHQRQATFARVETAAAASVDALLSRDPVPLGISLHWTTVRSRGDDYVGLGVSRATRVAAAAPAGSVLVTTEAAEQLGSHLPHGTALEDMGKHRLPGLSAPEHLYLLAHPGLEAAGEVTTGQLERTNLPSTDRSSFIGRADDIHDVHALLETHRLVTLTGPGGVGKTRLGLQVAADLMNRFRDGVWMVELAALEDPQLIAETVAGILEVAPAPGESFTDAMVRRCHSAETLLVLDNCEHLIDDVAALVDRLLAAGQGLRVLATSRERLGIQGEAAHQVVGLAFPPADVEHPAMMTAFDSVSLFVERARGVRPGYGIDEENAVSVASICRRLDGMPLAIELATSHLDVFSATEIAEGLDDRFEILGRRSRGRPLRQQTLQAVIDWSYSLLKEPERTLFRRLSVFSGGFDMEAVRAVCSQDGNADGTHAHDRVVTLVSALVAKSVVSVVFTGERSRYSLPETIHAYARRRLRDAGEQSELSQRHALHFSELGTTLASKTRGPHHQDAMHALRRDLDNLRSAFSWLMRHDPGRGSRLMGIIGLAWYSLGLSEEGLRIARQLVAAHEGPPSFDLCNVTLAMGRFSYGLGRLDDSGRLFSRSGDLAAGLADPGERSRISAISLGNLGLVAAEQGRYDDAAAYYRKELALLDSAEALELRASTVGNLADIELMRGDFEAALEGARESLNIARSTDDRLAESYAHLYIGQALLWSGRASEAEPHLWESFELAQELKTQDLEVHTRLALAEFLTVTGRTDEALDHGTDALEQAVAGFLPLVPSCLEVIALVFSDLGRFDAAAELIGAAHALAGRDADAPPSWHDCFRPEYLERIRAGCGPSWKASWNHGTAMMLEQAVHLANSE